MSELISLSPRLQMLADWVPQGSALADIGTDHGLLPAYLMLEKRISRAIAADIREGPLQRAKKTLRAYGLEKRVDTRLSNGLLNIGPEEFDCGVVAGMGGDMIARIFQRADYLKSPRYIFLLQPMSKEERLRSALWEQGFAILEERFAQEDEKLYVAFFVRYQGETPPFTPLDCIAGFGSLDGHYPDYLRRLLAKAERARDGVLAGGSAGREERLAAFTRTIEGLEGRLAAQAAPFGADNEESNGGRDG